MSQDSMFQQRPNDEGPSCCDPNNNLQNSLLFDDHNSNNNHTGDDLLLRNETVWQCGNRSTFGGDKRPTTTNHPFAFWNIIRTNIEECCIPQQRNQRNDETPPTFQDESSEHIYHDTISYNEVNTTENDHNSTGDNSKYHNKDPPTTTATTTTMTKHWMSTTNTASYTIEVWNAIVTALCLNVFMQFLTGKKK